MKRNPTPMVLVLLLVIWLPSGFAQESPLITTSVGQTRRAAEMIVKGDLGGADFELKNILALDPKNFRALNLLGVVRAQQKNTQEAERLFNQCIELNPNYAGARVNLGMLYADLGRIDEADAQLKQALEAEPGRPDAIAALVKLRRAQAAAALQQHEHEHALSLLLEARKLVPNDSEINFEFGMLALRMSLFVDAESALKTVLASHPENTKALYGMGRAQIGMAKFPDAKTTFERYLAVQPQDASGHYGLGIVLSALERPAEARRHFEKSIQLQPVQTEAYAQLGKLDLDQGQLEQAAEEFQRVLQRDPKHAHSLLGMGQLEFRRKNYPKAREYLLQAIASDPNAYQAHYHLGLTYARVNQKDEANRELELAKKLEREQLDCQRTLIKIIEPSAATPDPKK